MEHKFTLYQNHSNITDHAVTRKKPNVWFIDPSKAPKLQHNKNVVEIRMSKKNRFHQHWFSSDLIQFPDEIFFEIFEVLWRPLTELFNHPDFCDAHSALNLSKLSTLIRKLGKEEKFWFVLKISSPKCFCFTFLFPLGVLCILWRHSA